MTKVGYSQFNFIPKAEPVDRERFGNSFAVMIVLWSNFLSHADPIVILLSQLFCFNA